MKKIGLITLLLTLSPLAWPTTVAGAPLAHFDPGTLIETLANEGMSELLGHMAQTQSTDDPVTDKLITIAQLRARYADPRIDRADQLAAFEQMVEASRSLIQEYPDHYQRPLWQTNLASLLLFEKLQVIDQNAGEFYEFGIPTDKQQAAFESVAPEAFELLVDADIRFFFLKNDLPRQPDHKENRVQTGLWSRMMDEYYHTKTQFLLAHAAYYTSLLSDEHPYFKNLNNPKIPRQKPTAQEERLRLLDLTIEKLKKFVDDNEDPYRIRRASVCLTGRAMLWQPALLDKAIEYFDMVDQAGPRDLHHLRNQLAKAVAIEKNGPPGPAQQLLADLSKHPMVKQNLLFRLLVVDQDHRLKRDRAMAQPAGARGQALAEAYTPYSDLLSDPALTKDQAAGLKRYIYTRWESMVKPGTDLNQLPDSILAAAGEMARLKGENLVYQAEQLSQAGQEQEAEALITQSEPMLERAISINTDLLKRDSLKPGIRASAMFNLAKAVYLLAQGEPQQLVTAGNVWIDLAQEMPDQPLAEQAIDIAVKVLRQFYDLQPRPEGTAEAYERAAGVLFEHFPTSKIADNERVYYAFYVLTPKGKYTEAVALLRETPKDHPSYFESQQELLNNLKQIFDQAKKTADKNAAQNHLTKAARRIINDTKSLPTGADEQLRQDAHNALGSARLVLIDVSIAQGKTDETLQQLEGFEDEFRDNPDLVRVALSKSIVAYAQSDNQGQLIAQAKKMMGLYPDDAAAVIDEVLTDLNQRISKLTQQAENTNINREEEALRTQIGSYAQAALVLSELLLDWAVRQKYPEEDLVPFKLNLARANLLANQPQVALDILAPLLEEYPDDTDLIYNTGEALFIVGQEESLIDAAVQFDRLIGGLGPPYPPVWWRAWMRRLQIMDKLNTDVEDIPLRIRALELTDPNLGGEPFRSELKRLQIKHANQ